jgi:beta-carotene ketolase (CrtO type)
MFGDGTRIIIEETAEATAASIEQLSPADAAAWVELGERSQPVLKAFGLASEGWVPPPAVANGFARLVAGRRADPLIELTQLSVAELVTRWFENPYVRAMAMFRSVFSGLAPWTPGSAAAFLLTVAGHGRRVGRPVGGSQALIDALCAAIGAAGGTVRCGFDVVSVRQAGSTWTVRSRAGEEVTARRVVSAMPPRPFLLDVLDGDVPPRVRRSATGIEEVADNLSQLTLAAAIDDATVLPALGREDLDTATMWLLPDPTAATQVAAAAQFGQVPRSPGTLVTFPSRADASVAPQGSATMWANAFMPRRLAGRSWEDAAAEAADAVWRTIDACLPGIRSRVVHEVLTSPEELTALTGADNAGSHVAPTLRQTLGRRPAPGLGNYRTPVEGIYLSGAGTHPGSSVSGAPGRACARVILDDVGLAGRRLDRPRRVAGQVVAAVRAARAVRNSGVSLD